MRATSADLIELARTAGVRMTVIHHAFHYRKELRGKATAQGYSEFTALPIETARRVFDVLDGVPRTAPKASRQRVTPTAAPFDDVPEEWLSIGRESRFWSIDVCRTEAEKFVNWHKAKGSMFADWKAAWRNWVSGSHREDGKPQAASDMPDFTDPKVRQEYLAKWGK